MNEPTSKAPTGGAIDVAGLTKRYGQWTALDTVGFSVGSGEALGLWGPNGAGKTTIIRCLLGVAKYDGSVRIGGVDPAKDGRAVRRIIGYVPQNLPASDLTVAEMAAFVAKLKGRPFSDAEDRLATLGIAEQADKPLAALSGGLKQRLSLALALIGEPRVLLLDEPTANLDARGRAELLDLLLGLKRRGLTVVLCSHRQDDIARLADRVLMLEEGRVQAVLDVAEFERSLGADSRMVITLRNGHLPEALTTVKDLGLIAQGSGHVLSVELEDGRKADVLTALTRNGVDVIDFEMERTRWNDRS